MRAVRIILVVTALFVSAVGFAASGAVASRSISGARSAYSVKRVADPQSSLEYWTHRRMAAAEPMTMRSIGAEEIADLGGEPQVGEPYVVEASGPVIAQAVCTPGSGISEPRQPLPFERFDIPDPSAEPCRAHGMIFGRAFGQGFSCSGTVVNSDNRSMVWTAGHCVHGLDAQGQGLFFEDLIFVPGYENGVEPFGRWAAQELVAPTQWMNSEDLRFDFAAIVLEPNTSGALVADVVGSRGIAFNQQPNESFQSFGYPALPNPPFNGELLQSCSSGGSGRILDGVIAMGCDMHEGSSGGGWLIRDEFVSSNQSFGAPRLFPRVAFGPYLGETAKTLYNAARDGTTVFPQPTPTVAPGPVTTHTMKLTLRLRRHLVATGRLTAASGHIGCTQVAPLDIYRLTKRGARPIGRIRYTNAEGRFRVKLRDRTGRYFVYSPSGTYDLRNKCTETFSALRRHRH